MRHWRKGWVLVIAAVFIIAAAALFVWLRSPRFEAAMPDGSLLRVEKIAYGRRESFTPGSWWKRVRANIASHLPRTWAARIAPPPMGITSSWTTGKSATMTNFTGLHIWFTRRLPGGKGFKDVGVQSGEIVDEDGCIYASVGAGGEDNGLLTPATSTAAIAPGAPNWSNLISSGTYFSGGSVSVTSVALGSGQPPGILVFASGPAGTSVNWLAFESFPRYDRMLRLRVFDAGRNVLAEFELNNPAKLPYRPPAKWVPATLPLTKKEGDVAFILTGAGIKTNKGWLSTSGRPTPLAPVIVPTYDVRESGQSVDTWQAVDMALVGSSGNVAAKSGLTVEALCPREPAWKMTVKFAGSDHSPLAPNESWTLKGVKVPADGEQMRLGEEHKIQGVTVRLKAFTGPGVVTYTNDTGTWMSYADSSSGYVGGTPRTTVVRTPAPHIAVQFEGLTETQRLTVRAVDDQQREVYGRDVVPSTSWSSLPPTGISYVSRGQQPATVYMTFNLAEDARMVDLVFCVHTIRTEEFIFKPPAEVGKQKQ